MTTAKKTTAATKASTGNDQYVIIALPKDSFADGSTIRLIHELSMTEALDLLRAIKSKTVTKPPYKDYFNADEQIASVRLIKGTVQQLSEDFSSVLIDGEEYPLIKKEEKYNMIIGVK